jgi:hypothetical protein
MSVRKKYAAAIAIVMRVYASRISIESPIVGTEVVVLKKRRIVVVLSGSLGRAYWIGSELAGDVGR